MGVTDILEKIKQKKSDKVEEKSTKEVFESSLDDELDIITYNAIGFLPLVGSTNTEELIQNVALSFTKDKTVCILDLEDYYPKMHKIFGVKYPNKTTGLSEVLGKVDKIDLRDHLLKTNYENVYLLGFSHLLAVDEIAADDLKETIKNVKQLVEELKYRFSVVLINIPNHPFSEYMYAGIVSVDTGLFVVNQQVEWSDNLFRLKALSFVTAGRGGLGSFEGVIVNNYLEIGDDFEIVAKHDLNLVAVVPLVADTIAFASEGRCYVDESTSLDKQYVDAMDKIVQLILKD